MKHVECPRCTFFGQVEILGDSSVELYWECPECLNRIILE